MNLYEKVPEAVIRRMPKYYRYLSEKMLMGEERISSSHMSEELGRECLPNPPGSQLFW